MGVDQPDDTPVAADALKLALRVMFWVALGVCRVPTGTVISPVGPPVLTTPPAAIQPWTFSPVGVSRLPERSTWKLPARVNTVASPFFTTKKPPPWMAASRGPLLA